MFIRIKQKIPEIYRAVFATRNTLHETLTLLYVVFEYFQFTRVRSRFSSSNQNPRSTEIRITSSDFLRCMIMIKSDASALSHYYFVKAEAFRVFVIRLTV